MGESSVWRTSYSPQTISLRALYIAGAAVIIAFLVVVADVGISVLPVGGE